MGAFGRTAAEYGARQQTHTEETHTPAPHDATRVVSAVPGFDERDAAADPAGGSADWVADVIRAFLLSPSKGEQLLRPGLLAHPKEHAKSVDHVGLDSRRDGAVRPARLTRAPGRGR